MKNVLILGNGISRLKYSNFINTWQDEIWICNEAFKEHNNFPRIDRVGTVHDWVAILAYEYKQKYNLNYKIYNNAIIGGYQDHILSYTKPRGFSTGNELIQQAFIENYDRIVLVGFDFGGKDIYHNTPRVGKNFQSQYIQLCSEYDKKKIELIGLENNKHVDKITKLKIKGDSKIKMDEKYFNIRSNERVVIVGNSPNLLGKGLGSIIDSFEHVVRINDFVIEGFEKDVGTKTTIWTTGASQNTVIRKRDIDCTIMALLPLNRFRLTQKSFDDVIQHALDIPTEKINIVPKVHIHKIHDITGIMYCSSGLMAITYFRFIKGMNVSIVGFDFFQQYNNHYYDKKSALIGSSHRFEDEKKLVDKWIEMGLITLIDNDKALESNVKIVEKKKDDVIKNNNIVEDVKSVLLVGNEIPDSNFLSKWKGEIWVVNNMYLNYDKFPRINKVGTVHEHLINNMKEFRELKKLKFEIISPYDIKEDNISKFKNFGGYTTLIELGREALLRGYEDINFICVNYIGNFKMQYDSMAAIGKNAKKMRIL